MRIRHCAVCGRRLLNPLWSVSYLGRRYHLRCALHAGIMRRRRTDWNRGLGDE